MVRVSAVVLTQSSAFFDEELSANAIDEAVRVDFACVLMRFDAGQGSDEVATYSNNNEKHSHQSDQSLGLIERFIALLVASIVARDSYSTT